VSLVDGIGECAFVGSVSNQEGARAVKRDKTAHARTSFMNGTFIKYIWDCGMNMGGMGRVFSTLEIDQVFNINPRR
jgi:hypothetical protein